MIRSPLVEIRGTVVEQGIQLAVIVFHSAAINRDQAKIAFIKNKFVFIHKNIKYFNDFAASVTNYVVFFCGNIQHKKVFQLADAGGLCIFLDTSDISRVSVSALSSNSWYTFFSMQVHRCVNFGFCMSHICVHLQQSNHDT